MGKNICLSGLDAEMLDLLALKTMREKGVPVSRSRAVKLLIEKELGIDSVHSVDEWAERLRVKRGVDRGMENLERLNRGGGEEVEPDADMVAKAIKEAFGDV